MILINMPDPFREHFHSIILQSDITSRILGLSLIAHLIPTINLDPSINFVSNSHALNLILFQYKAESYKNIVIFNFFLSYLNHLLSIHTLPMHIYMKIVCCFKHSYDGNLGSERLLVVTISLRN